MYPSGHGTARAMVRTALSAAGLWKFSVLICFDCNPCHLMDGRLLEQRLYVIHSLSASQLDLGQSDRIRTIVTSALRCMSKAYSGRSRVDTELLWMSNAEACITDPLTQTWGCLGLYEF